MNTIRPVFESYIIVVLYCDTRRLNAYCIWKNNEWKIKVFNSAEIFLHYCSKLIRNTSYYFVFGFDIFQNTRKERKEPYRDSNTRVILNRVLNLVKYNIRFEFLIRKKKIVKERNAWHVDESSFKSIRYFLLSKTYDIYRRDIMDTRLYFERFPSIL